MKVVIIKVIIGSNALLTQRERLINILFPYITIFIHIIPAISFIILNVKGIWYSVPRSLRERQNRSESFILSLYVLLLLLLLLLLLYTTPSAIIR